MPFARKWTRASARWMRAQALHSILRNCLVGRIRDMVEPRPPAIWSQEALNDLDHLWGYYARVAGRTTADKILREIARVVAAIGDFPLAGRSRDEVRAG